MTRWKSITVETRREALDAVSHFFTTQGALGTAYDEQWYGPDGDPADPLPPPGEAARLTAYFPWETDLASLKGEFLGFLPALDESFGPGSGSFVSASEITDLGWAEKWKEHFKPQRIGRRITVKPSWEPYRADPDEVVLTVDPGQAFGTGSHETTRMCLRLIERIFSSGPPAARVLDFGTGTGILGIAAARLGAGRTLATDIDPKAVETANANARINGVSDRFRAENTPLLAIRERFDLIVANILAEILVDLKREIGDLCLPGGRLILSGILSEKGDWVAEEYAAEGLTVEERVEDGQWTALLLRREAAA